MKLFTIGFTKKSAEKFFETLKRHSVRKVIDIRLNNSSQLAGFAKGQDLKYFLKQICNIEYEHDIDFAPTKEILDNYKGKKITWAEYERLFKELLEKRKIKERKRFDNEYDGICLLCSEDTAKQCHRRLVAEYLKDYNPEIDLEIIHL